MPARSPQVKITILGDASSAQKAFRDTGDAAEQAEPRITKFSGSFVKTFAEIGAAATLGSKAADLALESLRGLADMVGEYNQKMQESSATILGVTKSQGALNQAFAFAESELKAGRSAYSDTVAAIAELTPTAKRANLDVMDLYRTTQLLAALNSGPEGGVAGAVVAINNALTGQFTSLQDRFNLSTTGIQAAIKAGIPPLQAINDALAKEGVTMDLVNAKSKTYANQMAIAKDQVARLAAEVGKPIFDALAEGLTNVNKQLESDSWQHYAQQYQQFVKLLIESLTSWKALSGVAEEVGIQVERSLQRMAQGFVNTGQFIADTIGKALRIPDNILADAQQHNPLQKLLDAWVGKTNDSQAQLDQWFKQNFADPIADAAQGNTPGGSGISPAAMQGYGRAVVENFVKGASDVQLGQLGDLQKLIPDSVKEGTAGYADATSDLAQALREVAQTGQISETTLYKLNSVFGAGTNQVAAQIVAYGQLTTATERHTAAVQAQADAEYNLQQVQNRAKGDLAGYQQAIDDANKAAADHAQAAQDAIEPLQRQLDGLRDAAEESARAGQQVLQGLQDDLENFQRGADERAAAFQAQIAAAQAAVSAASKQRQNDQALLNAALQGELEYEEQILDGLTDQQRATAARWQAEIDGQRRAKEGADQRVTNLSRAAHKEDLDFLTRINAARSSGNEKEARALERQLAQRQKQRQAAQQLAQAQAAVANDEFDAAEEKVQKEGKAQDVKDAQAEKAAQADLTRIQTAADAQKQADAQAIQAKQDQIKKTQDQQRAEQERSQDNERNIQREIDKIKTQADEQAKKDKKAIDDATTLYNNRQTFWALEETGAQTASNITGGLATGWERAEQAAKDMLQHLKDMAQVLKDNPALTNPQTPQTTGPFSPDRGQPIPNPPAPPAPFSPDRGQGNPVAPLLEGRPGFPPPAGYHSEVDTTGTFWYVPDGRTLLDYGKTPAGSPAPPAPAPAPPSSPAPVPGGNGSPVAGIGRIGGGGGGELAARAAGFGGEPSLSAFGAGPAMPVVGAAGGTTIVINAPNLRDIRDKRDLADLGAHLERTWHDIARGGRVKREVG